MSLKYVISDYAQKNPAEYIVSTSWLKFWQKLSYIYVGLPLYKI